LGDDGNPFDSELIFQILKFEYEMLQDEIKKNVKIVDTIKAVIIPVAIATIGWVATTENSLKAMELFAIGLASVSMIMLVWGISKRMHAINTVFFDRQEEIENYVERNYGYSMCFRRDFKIKLDAKPIREKLTKANHMLLAFCLAYAIAWAILIWINGESYHVIIPILVLIAPPLITLLWEGFGHNNTKLNR